MASIRQLAEVPHDLPEVMQWVAVVRAADLRLALVLAPVRALHAQASDAELHQIALSRQAHAAFISGAFGKKLNHVFPNVPPVSWLDVVVILALDESCSEAACKQDCACDCPHVVRR